MSLSLEVVGTIAHGMFPATRKRVASRLSSLVGMFVTLGSSPRGPILALNMRPGVARHLWATGLFLE